MSGWRIDQSIEPVFNFLEESNFLCFCLVFLFVCFLALPENGERNPTVVHVIIIFIVIHNFHCLFWLFDWFVHCLWFVCFLVDRPLGPVLDILIDEQEFLSFFGFELFIGFNAAVAHVGWASVFALGPIEFLVFGVDGEFEEFGHWYW